jgi:SAM-dependent methyltransferase
MSSPTIWSAGRYESVGERIAPIAAEVVDAADRRAPVRDAALLDLACGTGNAALAAATRGARVTAVDITPELITIAYSLSVDIESAGRSRILAKSRSLRSLGGWFPRLGDTGILRCTG